MNKIAHTKLQQLCIGLVASGALAGCAAEAPPANGAAPAPTNSAVGGGFDRSAGKGTLLYSTVKDGHLVQFLEMEPGITAVLEDGPEGQQPLLGAVAERTLGSVYSSLQAGDVPAAIQEADVRRAGLAATEAAKVEVSAPAHGAGEAYYTNGDQQWFRGQFCNGADVCVQGWDWAFTGSINGNNETFIGMVGSEGTTNGSLWLEYWYSKSPTWPWACGDCGSYWKEFDRVIVVPGHWVSIHVGGTYGLQGHLDGAGGGTQVSLAARR
ncbi:MAG: hypothetical protein JWN44_6420 [Myxococcales bacterium]|nr:hypothetical protein [Myxococcales bacterium]